MNRLALSMIAFLPLLLVVPAGAEEEFDLETLREERNEQLDRYHVRKLTQSRLNIAVELLEAGDNAAARKKLDGMTPSDHAPVTVRFKR